MSVNAPNDKLERYENIRLFKEEIIGQLIEEYPDETGSIKLSLWDDMIEQVKVGDKVKVENGYTNSFRGDVRVNVGRYGKLEVINE